MELPEEEKAVLVSAVSNIRGGLTLSLNLLDAALKSIEPVQDRMRKATLHEINDQHHDALKNFDLVKEGIRSSLEHIDKARNVIDTIEKGLFR